MAPARYTRRASDRAHPAPPISGAVRWSITTSILTLRNPDGHVLTYRVRPSIYPDLNARTIVTGERAGGHFRLAVAGSTKDNNHLYIVFETQIAPGEQWGSGAQASPGPTDCLADTVLGDGSLGGQTFLAAWARPDVAKVTTKATETSAETPLRFYDVPGSTLRIAGLWTATFRPSISPVTFYDRDGNVIAAYPNGRADTTTVLRRVCSMQLSGRHFRGRDR